MKITHAFHLSNAELTTELSRLAHCERDATVALIVHLAEFDARGLCEGEGFPSTFEYCTKVLRLSEDAACNRIKAARTARRYPIVLDMLTAGALSPTTARMLARHITHDNHQALLSAAAGKSKQEVEKILAGLFPQPDVPPSVRRLPATKPVPVPVTASLIASEGGTASGGGRDDCAPMAAQPGPAITAFAAGVPPSTPTAHPVVRPLAAERYEIRFTATAEMREKLGLAQDLLGHAIPSGDLAQVFDRALTVLVADLQRKKCGVTERPRRSRGQSEDSPHIPAAVRRAVWKRDGGRCVFVASSGRRCGQRRFVEFHHVDPYGAGGKPTVANVQLRCGVHNRYEARLFYGPGRRHGGGDAVSEPMGGYGCVADEFTRSGTGH